VSTEKEVGFVVHYFSHLNVAGIDVTKESIQVGDVLHFKGHTTDFEQTITSMQIEHKEVAKAKKGDSIGMQVSDKVRVHDKVFKVI